MSQSFSHSFYLPGEGATERFAARLAFVCRPGDVLALEGTLGIGKTALARAFIRALTSKDEDVPSPTFTLVQTYETESGPVYHFDLYRLDSPDDAIELGIDDAFAEGINLIEWPDRLGSLLPRRSLIVRLQPGNEPDGRYVKLKGDADWEVRLQGILER